MSEPLVSGKTVAKHLSMSYSALMHWVREGSGPPAYRLNPLSNGNVDRKKRQDGQEREARWSIRFRISEVEDWLQKRRI